MKKELNKCPEPPTVISYYKSFDEFSIRIKSLKLPHGWNIENADGECVKIQKQDQLHMLPQFEIFVNINLIFTVRVFTWSIPDFHNIYVSNCRSCKNITLSNLITVLSNYKNLFRYH